MPAKYTKKQRKERRRAHRRISDITFTQNIFGKHVPKPKKLKVVKSQYKLRFGKK